MNRTAIFFIISAQNFCFDAPLVRSTLDGVMAERPMPTAAMPQGICLDKGYDFDEVRDIVWEFGFTAHIRARDEEAKAIKQEAGFRRATGLLT